MAVTVSFSFSFNSSAPHRDLHSFPTRRSSDLHLLRRLRRHLSEGPRAPGRSARPRDGELRIPLAGLVRDRKSTRLYSSHVAISYAVFCLKKKNNEFHISTHV